MDPSNSLSQAVLRAQGQDDGPIERRFLALAVACPDPAGTCVRIRAWAFDCRCQRELDEIDVIHRQWTGGRRDAAVQRRWAAGAPYHYALASVADARAARAAFNDAAVDFAALSRWGAGPLDGHFSEHALAARATGAERLALIDASMASFVERLALAVEAPLPPAPSPARPRL